MFKHPLGEQEPNDPQIAFLKVLLIFLLIALALTFLGAPDA